MQPNLATYQAAANSIYDPLQQGELGVAAAGHQSNVDTLNNQKSGVASTYADSIYALNKSTQTNSAKIQQQYTLALGGNFSGLQGNDMGMMFADAAHEQGSIETARDNALNDIGSKLSNETQSYNANVGAITGKYSSQKNQYAQDQYGAAVNAYQQSLIDQQKLQLEYAKLSSSNAKSSAPNAAAIKQQDMSTIASQLQGKAGKDGHVSQETWNAAMASWIGAGYNAKDFSSNFTQFINQKYKGYHGFN